MIDLTPLEVRKKKGDFRKGMRGYDPQSVDDFLDLVADRLEQLVRENAAMSDRLARVEEQVSDYRERERALTEALVTAQEMRAEMRKQIEREVELKRREAEADADNIRASAEQMREREEETIRRLRARQSQFVQSYRAFLERELTELAVMTESLDLNRTAIPSATPAPRRSRKREAAREREPEAERPQPDEEPAPLPAAMPEPDPFEFSAPPSAAVAPAAAAPPPAPVAGAYPSAEEKSFDDMLNSLPPFAGAAEVKQMEIGESAEAASDAAFDEADYEAEILADVRAEFDEIAAEEPVPEAEEEVLDLVDDVAEGENEDGWMSTLLEGKVDKRS